ncbi:MAG: permease-like cell division protein FtsX [Fimbriimonadaceae bacterium]
MFDRLEFLLMEALVAIRRNLLMTFAAVSTAAVALFLLGGLAYVYWQVNQLATDVSGKFEVRVWLKDEVKGAQITNLAKRMRKVNGVKKAMWVPRDKEWQKMQTEMPEMTRGVDQNPLTDSFKLILNELGDAPGVKRQIQQMPEVVQDGVVYMKDQQELMDNVLHIVRWVGGVLGSILLVTSAILIYNAIRLTILARRREIRIMQLVGASNLTIRTPFIIEGILQGATGGIVAALLIRTAQSIFEGNVKQFMISATFPTFPTWTAIGLLAGIGAVFGAFCSYLAIREPLRYRVGSGI